MSDLHNTTGAEATAAAAEDSCHAAEDSCRAGATELGPGSAPAAAAGAPLPLPAPLLSGYLRALEVLAARCEQLADSSAIVATIMEAANIVAGGPVGTPAAAQPLIDRIFAALARAVVTPGMQHAFATALLEASPHEVL